MLHPLRTIEWHDLPIAKLLINKSGFELHVLPYNENLAQYDTKVFSLSDAESLSFDFSGILTRGDLENLEVHSLEFQELGVERISGKIKILLGSKYWEIQFVNACWKFHKL